MDATGLSQALVREYLARCGFHVTAAAVEQELVSSATPLPPNVLVALQYPLGCVLLSLIFPCPQPRDENAISKRDVICKVSLALFGLHPNCGSRATRRKKSNS